jgi:hypothetical protein
MSDERTASPVSIFVRYDHITACEPHDKQATRRAAPN